MKKLIMLSVVVVVISVSATILGCSNSKASGSSSSPSNQGYAEIAYEDKEVKVYLVSIGNGYAVVAYAKKSGSISSCR